MSLAELFSEVGEFFLWVWNYPIPLDAIGRGLGLIAIGAGAFSLSMIALTWLARGLWWTLGIAKDAVEVGRLLVGKYLRRTR